MNDLQKNTDNAALTEAIKHAIEVAVEKSCTPCGKEHETLAFWLLELHLTRTALLKATNDVERLRSELAGSLAKNSALQDEIRRLNRRLEGRPFPHYQD